MSTKPEHGRLSSGAKAPRPAPGSLPGLSKPAGPQPPPRTYLCDRCGHEMVERQCKVICPNCGSRWDCSDLSIYVDDPL